MGVVYREVALDVDAVNVGVTRSSGQDPTIVRCDNTQGAAIRSTHHNHVPRDNTYFPIIVSFLISCLMPAADSFIRFHLTSPRSSLHRLALFIPVIVAVSIGRKFGLNVHRPTRIRERFIVLPFSLELPQFLELIQ